MPRNGPMNASVYVKNLPPDSKSEELAAIFGKYGPVSDVYIPLDYYTRAPRGFAYVQYEDPRDADDAIYYMKNFRYLGSELKLEFARSERKTPQMMRTRERGWKNYDDDEDEQGYGYSRRRSGSRSPRRKSYSRSVSPKRSPRRYRGEDSYRSDDRRRRY